MRSVFEELPAATKLGQGNIFTRVCQEFCPQGEGEGVCLSACWDTHPPDQADSPPDQADTPPDQADPPGSRPPQTRQTPPQGQTPPWTRQTPRTRQTPPPQTRQTPPREADSSRRSTSGLYASYWNAFLLF